MSAGAEIILKEMLAGSLTTALSVVKILVPLMIVIEILMVYKVIEKLARRLEGLGKLMGMSRNAIFPLLVGVVMGVTYGAGTIIEINRQTPLSRKDMALVAVFMYLCHGVIETSVILAAAGANIWVVSLGRLLFAFLVTAIAARLPHFRRMDGPERLQDGGPGEL